LSIIVNDYHHAQDAYFRTSARLAFYLLVACGESGDGDGTAVGTIDEASAGTAGLVSPLAASAETECEMIYLSFSST
jgi:hypothetical protein